jgi:hypothetical protein
VKARVTFAEGFAFTYAFRADGNEHLLTVTGPKGKFTLMTTLAPGKPPTSQEPSVEQIEGLCSHLAQVVAGQIEQALSQGKPFAIDGRWSITTAGIEIDGQRVPWAELNITADDSTGDVEFRRGNRRIAGRSMMSDNVLGALAFLRSRADPAGSNVAA